MIKLFGSDLDLTLLIDQRIRGRNVDAIQRLNEAGVRFCLVSGRVITSCRYLLRQAGVRGSCIGSNGAVAMDEEGKLLWENPMDTETVLRVIAIADRYGQYYHLYDREALYTPYFSPGHYRHLSDRKRGEDWLMQCPLHIDPELDKRVDQLSCLKIQLTLDGTASQEIIRELRDIPSLAVTASESKTVEVMAGGTSKWQGLLRLAAYYGLGEGEIGCCGDYLNDLAMVGSAPYSFAPANAHPLVKEAASFVSLPYDQYGFAAGVDSCFERGWIGEK